MRANSLIEHLGFLGLDFERVRPLLPTGRMDAGVGARTGGRVRFGRDGPEAR